MFHILALCALGLLSVFAATSYIGVWRRVIETRKYTLDEFELAPVQQKVHTWLAVVLLVLMLVTYIFAPVPWYFTVVAVALFLAHHVSLRGIAVPNHRVRTLLKWLIAIAEFLYLVYLAFGVR